MRDIIFKVSVSPAAVPPGSTTASLSQLTPQDLFDKDTNSMVSHFRRNIAEGRGSSKQSDYFKEYVNSNKLLPPEYTLPKIKTDADLDRARLLIYLLNRKAEAQEQGFSTSVDAIENLLRHY